MCALIEGEKANDEQSCPVAYANLCDIFVMDAFGTAHRAQASTHGVAQICPQWPVLARYLWGELSGIGTGAVQSQPAQW